MDIPFIKKYEASLHVDTTRSKISHIEAMSILNQFLSISSWLDDTYSVLHGGGAGSTKPVQITRDSKNILSSIVDIWCNSWQPIEDMTVRRALSIYREALNMYHFYSIPYSVLGFYKIIEIGFGNSNKIKEFIESKLKEIIEGDAVNDAMLREVGIIRSTPKEEISDFLIKEGRHAVAHANKEPTVDPDNVSQVRRLSGAAAFLQPLAREFIIQELGVSTERWAESYLG